MPCAAWHRRCQIPDVRTGCPALPSFPGFPLGRIPSSAVRDFYCQSAGPHKGFRREVQDSFFIHMTSAVYPLCTATFHRAVHTLIHRICGRRPNRRSMVFSARTGSRRRDPSEGGWPSWSHRVQEEGNRCRQTQPSRARLAGRRRSPPGNVTARESAPSPRPLASRASSLPAASPPACPVPRMRPPPASARRGPVPGQAPRSRRAQAAPLRVVACKERRPPRAARALGR